MAKKVQESKTQQAAIIREALDSMNSALAQKFKEIKHSLDSAKSVTILSMYDIGARCKEVEDNPVKYGKNAMDVLARAFLKKKRILRQAIKFAREWTQEEVSKLVTLKNESLNFSLSYEHMKQLLNSSLTKQQQEKYIQLTLREGWTNRELQERILKETGRRINHGRAHDRPTTKSALLEQIRKFSETWLKKYENVWRHPSSPAIDELSINLSGLTSDEYMLMLEVTEVIGQLASGVMDIQSALTALRSPWKVAHDAQLARDQQEAPVEAPSGELPARDILEVVGT